MVGNALDLDAGLRELGTLFPAKGDDIIDLAAVALAVEINVDGGDACCGKRIKNPFLIPPVKSCLGQPVGEHERVAAGREDQRSQRIEAIGDDQAIGHAGDESVAR